MLYDVCNKDVTYLFIDEIQTNQTLIKNILGMFSSTNKAFVAAVNPYLMGIANKLTEDYSEKEVETMDERLFEALNKAMEKMGRLKVVFVGTPLLYIKEKDNVPYGEYATNHLNYKKEIDITKYKNIKITHCVLAGLSFREHLKYFHNINLQRYSLDEIFEGKVNIFGCVNPEPYFEEYLKTGYYPFAEATDFKEKLTDAINKTIYLDAFAKDEDAQEKIVNGKREFIFSKVFTSSKLPNQLVAKLMRLAILIAKKIPFEAVDVSIANELKCSRNDIPIMLSYMERVGLISCFSRNYGVYIKNAALNYFLCDYANAKFSLGNKQEAKAPSNGLKCSLDEICKSFFLNQVSVVHNVVLKRGGRFSVGKYNFSFSPTQKKTQPNPLKKTPSVYVKRRGVQDEVEVPIWQFGLLY